jgi:ATP-binding cassette subfamily F protein 3
VFAFLQDLFMIDFQNVSKSYGGQIILNSANFRINPGERVGIVGANGSGKSTILGLISGEIVQDKGEVLMPNDYSIGYLRQQLPEHFGTMSLLDYAADANPKLSAALIRLREIEQLLHENQADKTSLLREHGELQANYEHAGGYRLRSEAEAALCGLGFHPKAFSHSLNTFSGGWQMRGGLTRVLIAKPDIMLLDEPSNYLDTPAVEWLCRFLKAYNGTLLLISHDRYLLKKLTGITFEVNSGKVTRYSGDYDFYRSERDFRFKTLEAAKRNQDRKREQLERTIERFRAKNTKAAQAQSMMKRLDKMDVIDMPQSMHFSGSIILPTPPQSGAEAVRLDDVCFAYNPETVILDNVSLQIERGDKVAIIGYNGTGKTTLLRLIAGRLAPNSGRVVLGHNIIQGYQAQEFADILSAEQSVYDVVRAALPENGEQNALQSVLGAFGFSGDAVHKQVKVLSGGEKIRLCFARIFVNPPNLLLLDEPTTHLDIVAREALQDALSQYSGALCLVSHDIEFIGNVATSIIAMKTPTVKKYFGNYQYYQQKISEEIGGQIQCDNAGNEKEANAAKERRRARAKLRQEIQQDKKNAEKKIAILEKQLESLELEKIQLTTLFSSGQIANYAESNRRMTLIQKEIEQITSEWEVTAEKLESIMRINAEIHAE